MSKLPSRKVYMPLRVYGIISDGNPWLSTAYTRILKGVGLSLTSVTLGRYSWNNPSGGDRVKPTPPRGKQYVVQKSLFERKYKELRSPALNILTPHHWSTSLADCINQFLIVLVIFKSGCGFILQLRWFFVFPSQTIYPFTDYLLE